MAQETPTNPLTQTTLSVVVKGETFIFKVPSIRDEAKVGSIARFLRAKDDPQGIGAAEGLDVNTFSYYQALAIISVLLKQSSSGALFSRDAKGMPVVDVDQLPEDAPVMEVYEGFLDALVTFREGASRPKGSTEPTPVASGEGPQL